MRFEVEIRSCENGFIIRGPSMMRRSWVVHTPEELGKLIEELARKGTERTDKELIDSEVLEDKATKWVSEVVPKIYEGLEKAGIHYDEEMICHLLSDGFKIGYATCFRELRGQDSPQ